MTAELYLLAGLALGGATGALVGWLLGVRRSAHAPNDPLLLELRQQLTARENELTASREQAHNLNSALATATAQQLAAEKQLQEQRATHTETLAALQQTQAKAIVDLREAFRALSAQALQETQPEFLRLANETLGKFQETARGDLAQRQERIATLVKPLEEQLKTYQQRLAQSETAQSASLGALQKQLETLTSQSQTLSAETVQLRRVLSSNQARGRWGEETLRRVVETAGMSIHCDFTEQTVAGDGKPDMTIHLPGNRVIIVDAKVPDLEFLQQLDVTDETQRRAALANHAAKLKNTIKHLAERNYPSQFENALDHVILFLPAESLFSAALEGDQDLMIWAQTRRILLATPASLIAILRSVSLTWLQHDQSENARAIAAAAQELYNRITHFTLHFSQIGAGLERAGKAFNDAVGSYERRIRPSGERLIALGTSNDSPPTPPQAVTVELRSAPRPVVSAFKAPPIPEAHAGREGTTPSPDA